MAVPTKLIAYVTNSNDNVEKLVKVGTVVPVDLEAQSALEPIPVFGPLKSVGSGTNAIIVTADGKTAFVSNELVNGPTGTVSKIDLASGKVSWSVAVGQKPVDIEFVPNSGEEWAWVANLGDQSVTTVNLAKGEAGMTIKVDGQQPNTVAFSPDGSLCYVANWQTDNPAGSSVTIIKVTDNGAAGTVLTSFLVGLNPNSVAFTQDGSMAYVVNKGSKSLTPVDVATNTPEAPIAMPGTPILIGVSPDGTFAYVMIADDTTDAVVRLDLTTKPATAGAPIHLVKGCQPHWVAFTPDGTTAYIVGNGNSTLTPITVAGDVVGTPITVSSDPAADILDIAIVEVE